MSQFSFSTYLIKPNPVPNPNYDPKQLEELEHDIDVNSTIEIAPNMLSSYRNYSALLDQGIYTYHTRGELLNEKGFSVLEKLIRNSSVYPALTNFKLSVVESRLIVKAKNNSWEAGFTKELLEYFLCEMDGTIEDRVFDILSAVVPGYSISEKVYKNVKYEKSYWRGLKAIKTKKAGLYGFNVDAWDNIENVVFLNFNNIALPVEKFIIYSFLPMYGNPYGFGLFDVLYPLYFAINEIWKLMLIGTSKNAIPSTVVYVPSGLGESEQNTVKTFIKNIGQSSAAMLPESVKAQLLEIANRNSSNPAIPAIQLLMSEIEKVILLNDLTISQSKGGGTRAETSAKIEHGKGPLIAFIRRALEDVLKEQLIRPLLRYNLDPDDFPITCFPDLIFNDQVEENKAEFISIIGNLTQLGYINPNNKQDREWIRQKIEAPKELDQNSQNNNQTIIEENNITIPEIDETHEQQDMTELELFN